MRVKTAEYNLFTLENELRDCAAPARAFDGAPASAAERASSDAWYAPKAAAELVFYRSLIEDYEHGDVMRVVLARAARSARRTTHFDLDFPREPQIGEYWCHKHRKTCRPDRARRALPAPLRARHARADPRVLARARART